MVTASKKTEEDIALPGTYFTFNLKRCTEPSMYVD